jgi:hypothetical protein
MCGIYGKLSPHQIDASVAETATRRLLHCAAHDSRPTHRPTESRMTRHGGTPLIVVPRLVSYITEQRRIYESLFRISPTSALLAAAC